MTSAAKLDYAARLKEIHERVSRATPGPWLTDDREPRMVILSGDLRRPSLENFVATTWQMREPFAPTETTPDADFIAHSREDIPFLLSVIDDLAKIKARAEFALATFRKSASGEVFPPELLNFGPDTAVRIIERILEGEGYD